MRGKWVCAACQTLVQAPVPAHFIDKGLLTTGPLAQVLVAKYADHLPLYRQETIFERAGVALAPSTLAQWVGAGGVELQPLVDALKAALLIRPVLHVDETPVAMRKPGHGKTHRAYLWSYGTSAFDPIKGVVFDFADSRTGRHVQAFLGAGGPDVSDGGWRGTLLCDACAGYKALFGKRILWHQAPRRQAAAPPSAQSALQTDQRSIGAGHAKAERSNSLMGMDSTKPSGGMGSSNQRL